MACKHGATKWRRADSAFADSGDNGVSGDVRDLADSADDADSAGSDDNAHGAVAI
jgi:hypothetical protein